MRHIRARAQRRRCAALLAATLALGILVPVPAYAAASEGPDTTSTASADDGQPTPDATDEATLGTDGDGDADLATPDAKTDAANVDEPPVDELDGQSERTVSAADALDGQSERTDSAADALQLDAPIVARLAADGTYCSAPGVYSLDDSLPSNSSNVRSLALSGVGGTDAVTGAQSWLSDALGIVPNGSAAWAATRYGGTTGVWLHRLGADQDTAVQMHYQESGLANLGTITAGAVTRIGMSDYFYFGSFSHTTGGQVRLELFAYNITTNTWIGQVGRVLLFTSLLTTAGAGGDIAFDAQGNLVILWSHTSSRLYRVAAASVPTTEGTSSPAVTALTTAITTTGSQPWNGLAYDTSGNLWISRANTTATPRTSNFAIVNPSTGALSSTTSKSGFAVNDLASCGNTPPKLTVQKSLPIGRFASGDQFTLDIRQSGNTTNLAAVTTSGTASGVQAPAAGPIDVVAGTSYTIAETAANGANLANYTLTYGCVWDNGDVFVAAGAALPVTGTRAQSTLPAMPSSRNGQTLTCTITNVAKAVAFTLQTSLTNARFATGDQFTLDIRQSGSTTNLASATTTSTGTGVQTPAAGPYNVVAGAVYTIAETGAGGASLGNYTSSYGCAWGNGDVFVAPGAALAYNINTGRAQASLPAIPAGRDGQTLVCTITNTAKNPADVPPRIDLQKSITSRTAGHQFHLAVNRTFDHTLIAENTTTGTTTGLQTDTVARGTAEQGVTYTISEGAAGTATNLNAYAARFVCSWSGGGELARGVLSAGANGRLQAMLPAIPAGRNGQVLTCTITNQLTPASALDCTVDSVYALQDTSLSSPVATNRTHYALRVTGAGTSTGTIPPDRINFGSVPRQNGLALNLDGSSAIAVNQAPSSNQVVMRKWTPGTGNGTITQSNLSRTGATTPPTPSDFIGGAIDPTTGDYYFGGYTTEGSFLLFVVRSNATTYQYVRSVVINSNATSGGNGDITFDANGNLYFVWSLNSTHILARLDADRVNSTGDATKIADLTASSTFNGIAFNGRGELFTSGGFGIMRLDPSTGKPIGGTRGNGIVATTTGIVDLASCGLPPTMRLQKDIDARGAASDQFRLEIRADNTAQGDTLVQNATTTGATTGIQNEYAGTMVVTVGKSYTIREIGTRSSGSTDADLSKYITSYSCQWSDETTPVASSVLSTSAVSNAREARVGPIPSASEVGTAKGKAGQQLVCTITNTPVVAATVAVKKTVLDPLGQHPAPGVGWDITATRLASSTAGTTISGPPTKTTISGGSVPTVWEVSIPNSSAFVNVRISETQQTGYDLVPGTGSGATLSGSYCTVTPPIGQPRVVLITATAVDVPTVTAGEYVECEFVNKQRAGSVTWQKVDAASTAIFLSGSEWTLTGPSVPDGTIVVDCVAASDALCPAGTYADTDSRPGRFRLTDLLHGSYTLTEHRAPAGFVRVTTPHDFVIAPASLDHQFAEPFENERIPMPAIPLTGGTPGDAFLLVGGGLLLLALLGAGLQRRRRARDPQS